MTPFQSACDLAENYGLPVIPCRREFISDTLRDKASLNERGRNAASTSLEQIDDWWQVWPTAMVGVPTGVESKLLVIDIDPKGMDWYTANIHRFECGRIHKTKRGFHLLYRYTGTDIRNSVGGVAPGVDVRSNGGYIIWWPSEGLEPTGGMEDLTEPPLWILEVARGANRKDNVADIRDASDGNTVGSGGRNEYLSRKAYALRKEGYKPEQIFNVLKSMNAEHCNPPLSDGEVQGIAAGKASIAPEQRQQAESHAITFRSVFDIANDPKTASWLLKPYVEQKCSILMFGDAGTFKSFLALDWAMQIAQSGLDVIYLSAEGRGLWKRLRAWCIGHHPNRPWQDTLKAMPRFLAIEVPLNLSDLATLATLQAGIDQAGLTPSFVVIDTLARYSDGEVEEKNSAAGAYLNQLDQAIRVKYGASILIVHHTGLTEKQRARGPYSLTANTDANFRVERPDVAKMEIVVTSGRMKDCESPPPFSALAQVIDLDEVDEGRNPISSLSLLYTGAAPVIPKRPTGKAQKALMSELEKLLSDGGLGIWTQQELREISRNLGSSKSTARDAVVGLVQAQFLTPTIGGYRLSYEGAKGAKGGEK